MFLDGRTERIVSIHFQEDNLQTIFPYSTRQTVTSILCEEKKRELLQNGMWTELSSGAQRGLGPNRVTSL